MYAAQEEKTPFLAILLSSTTKDTGFSAYCVAKPVTTIQNK